jgi:MscS family membrane protein
MYYFQTIWQWCLMVVLLLVSLVSVWACYRWWNRKVGSISAVKRMWGRALIIFAGAMLALLDLYILTEHVGITGPVLIVSNLALRTVFWFLLAGSAHLFGLAVGETIINSPRIDSRGIHASLVIATAGIIGVIAAAIIIFYGLSRLGVSLIPLIAGLGVGGLAVALAARPTLENLIGGFMILLDRLYRIGQRVLVKGYEGDVEKEGIEFAFPTTIHYLTQPDGEPLHVNIDNGPRPDGKNGN